MDYHNIHESREECSSSESGWTMYIASPDHEYSFAEDQHEHDSDRMGGQGVDEAHNAENNESDDSMVSDASSGPSHHGFVYRGINGERDSKHAEQKGNSKGAAGKKQQRQVVKKPSNQDKKAGKHTEGKNKNRKK